MLRVQLNKFICLLIYFFFLSIVTLPFAETLMAYYLHASSFNFRAVINNLMLKYICFYVKNVDGLYTEQPKAQS